MFKSQQDKENERQKKRTSKRRRKENKKEKRKKGSWDLSSKGLLEEEKVKEKRRLFLFLFSWTKRTVLLLLQPFSCLVSCSASLSFPAYDFTSPLVSWSPHLLRVSCATKNRCFTVCSCVSDKKRAICFSFACRVNLFCANNTHLLLMGSLFTNKSNCQMTNSIPAVYPFTLLNPEWNLVVVYKLIIDQHHLLFPKKEDTRCLRLRLPRHP